MKTLSISGLCLVIALLCSSAKGMELEDLEQCLEYNHNIQRKINALSFEMAYTCYIHPNNQNSYTDLPDSLKSQIGEQVLQSDTFAEGTIECIRTNEGLFYGHINEVKHWVDVKDKTQTREAAAVVSNDYSGWRQNNSMAYLYEYPSINEAPFAVLAQIDVAVPVDYLIQYGITVGKKTLWEYYNSVENVSWEVEKDGQNVSVFEYKNAQNTPVCKRVFDLEKDCQMSEFVLYDENGDVFEKTDIELHKIELEDKSTSLWFPYKIQIEIFKKKGSVKYISKNKKIVLENIQLNPVIQQQRFEIHSLNFQEGQELLWVKQDKQKEVYVFKKGRLVEKKIQEIIEEADQVIDGTTKESAIKEK